MSAGNPYEATTSVPKSNPRRTLTIKRLDVMSCAMMMGVLYAILGLVVGGFFSLMALVGVAAQGQGLAAGLIGGFGAIIIMPLMYGLMGFLGGLIGALLYNLCAGIIGGIKFDIE